MMQPGLSGTVCDRLPNVHYLGSVSKQGDVGIGTDLSRACRWTASRLRS